MTEAIGSYRLTGELARGGMGVVYRAQGPHGPCALKLLTDDSLVPRFEEEIRMALELDHPGIVRTFDAGRDADGRPYMVMELIEGQDLAERLRVQGPLRPPEAVDCAIQLSFALEHAHALGVLHRDLKPANVLELPGGGYKLADFGIGKRIHVDQRLTVTGELIGTPNYMAPEQLAAKVTPLDARADVYGLGATLYALLTGSPPFPGRELLSVLHDVAREDPPSPRLARPDLDPRLEAICLRCLAKSPDARFATVGELRDALEALTRRPHPTAALAAGALVLAVAAGGAAALWPAAGAPPAAAASAAAPSPATPPPRASASPAEPPTDVARKGAELAEQVRAALDAGRYAEARDLLAPWREQAEWGGAWAFAELGHSFVAGPLPLPPERIGELERATQRALAADPRDRYALAAQGELLRRAADLTLARQHAAQLHEADPDWPHARLLLARLQRDQPLTEIARLLSLPPQPPRLQAELDTELGTLLRRAHLPAIARDVWAAIPPDLRPYVCNLHLMRENHVVGDDAAGFAAANQAFAQSRERCRLALTHLAQVRQLQGDFDLAIDYVERALAIEDEPALRDLQVEILRLAGRQGKALEVVRASVAQAPTPHRRRVLAALQAEAEPLDPLLADALHTWQRRYLGTSEIPATLLAACGARLRETPDDPAALLANAYLRMTPAAAPGLLPALEQLAARESPPGLAHHAYAQALIFGGQGKRALDLLDRWILAAPPHPRLAWLHLLRADLLLKDDPARARGEVLAGLDLDPHHVPLRCLEAATLVSFGEHAAAWRTLQLARQIDPGCAQPYIKLADLLQWQGAPDAAQAALDQAAAAGLDMARLDLIRVRLDLHAGRIASARSRLASSPSTDVYAHRLLSALLDFEALIQQGPWPPPVSRLDAIDQRLSQLAEEMPQDPIPLVTRTRLRFAQSGTEYASRDLADLVARWPLHVMVSALQEIEAIRTGAPRDPARVELALIPAPDLYWFQIVRICALSASSPRTVRWLLEGLARHHPNHLVLYALARICLELGDAAEGARWCDLGLQLGPSVPFHMLRTQSYALRGDTAAVRSEADAAVAAFPDAAMAYRFRADVLDQLGDTEAAEADRRRAAELEGQ